MVIGVAADRSNGSTSSTHTHTSAQRVKRAVDTAVQQFFFSTTVRFRTVSRFRSSSAGSVPFGPRQQQQAAASARTKYAGEKNPACINQFTPRGVATWSVTWLAMELVGYFASCQGGKIGWLVPSSVGGCRRGRRKSSSAPRPKRSKRPNTGGGEA